MAGTVKKLQFSEGTDVGAPTDLSLATSTTVISPFADDTAYVTSEGPAADGSVYLNTTTKKFRHYISAWRNAVPESDAADATKLFLVDLTGQTTAVSSTLVFTSTANRLITFPDAAITVAGRANSETLSNKTLASALLSGGTLDVASAGNFTFAGSVGANSLTIGSSNTTVVVAGNLQVDGTTTTVNTATLDVEDANITINNGGNDASAEGAGLTVERTGTSGSLAYEDALASKFKIGAAGSEAQVATVSHTQTLSNKTLLENLVDNYLDMNEESAPSTPGANKIRLYAKADGNLYWKDDAGTEKAAGASGSSESVHTVTSANYIVLDGDGYTTILVSTGGSDRTIGLPTLADNLSRKIRIKKIDSGSGNVIIDGEGVEQIEGVNTYTLRAENESVTLQADESGTEWYKVADKQASKSYIHRFGGNGHGSTSTTVRRYAGTYSLSAGSAITDNSGAAEGGVFDINEDGIYFITASDSSSTGTNRTLGITLNSSQLTTSVDAFSDPTEILNASTWAPSGGNGGVSVSWTGPLYAGDIIRVQDNGDNNATNDTFVHFFISQVVKF